MKAVLNGKIKLVKYDEFIRNKKNWLYDTIKKEYEDSKNQPEYKYFLENKFNFLK